MTGNENVETLNFIVAIVQQLLKSHSYRDISTIDHAITQ